MPLLTITESALEQVLDARADEANPEELALWIEVTGSARGEFTYDLYFQSANDAGDADSVETQGPITVVVPAASVDKLRGATLDMSKDLLNPGMVINNPNRPQAGSPPMAAASDRPPADLSSPVAQRVLAVLEEQINPAIAAHGGTAELVAVEDDAVYLRLGGGCVGCGMAAVTLSQGIEVAIRDAIPEISRVVDVTDHASGTNPYFEASKK